MTALADIIRNNQELSDAIYAVIAKLAAYHLSQRSASAFPLDNEYLAYRIIAPPPNLQDLCRLAAMILPHLPAPKPAPDGEDHT